MGAPKGNSYYLLRAKSGRNKKYKTSDSLLTACYQYFEDCEKNPWFKNEAVKSGDFVGRIIQVPTARPYTLTGMWIYIGITRQTWETYKGNKDFLTVITHIEEIIYTQKYEGAAVGAFNANIIARDLGLKDSASMEHSGNVATTVIYKQHPGNEPLPE